MAGPDVVKEGGIKATACKLTGIFCAKADPGLGGQLGVAASALANRGSQIDAAVNAATGDGPVAAAPAQAAPQPMKIQF